MPDIPSLFYDPCTSCGEAHDLNMLRVLGRVFLYEGEKPACIELVTLDKQGRKVLLEDGMAETYFRCPNTHDPIPLFAFDRISVLEEKEEVAVQTTLDQGNGQTLVAKANGHHDEQDETRQRLEMCRVCAGNYGTHDRACPNFQGKDA